MKQETVYTLEYFVNIEDPEYPHFPIGVSKSAVNALKMAKKYLSQGRVGAVQIYAFTTDTTAFKGSVVNVIYG